jgi:ribonuclease J
MKPTHKDFWFLPLGGCGEIGMNLNLYGHAGKWLMVDCGVTFEKSPGQPGNRVEMADPLFISSRQQALVGIIATHAHEDHIGALAHLWDQFRCPIYTTEFTRQVLIRKLRQKGINALVITVNENEILNLDPFEIRWLPVTHSTPETNALLISTAAGTVLHTADWKLDSAPVVGEAFNPERYLALADLRIDAIVCDSTNANHSGSSVSEGELFEGLLAKVRESAGRVVVACFASNIARLQTLGNVAHVSGRYLGLLGRSLHNMTSCAKAAGYLQNNFMPVSNTDIGYLLPAETLMVATGSQGELNAALHRLAMDTHPDISLAAGDHVIFSAKTIPGNESDVERLIRSFEARNIRVTHASQLDDSNKQLHASGHPCADELLQMYRWVRPRIAIPVHGEAEHMSCNAALAKAAGIACQLQGMNGDLFDIVRSAIKRKAAPVGRLWFDEQKNRLEKVTD